MGNTVSEYSPSMDKFNLQPYVKEKEKEQNVLGGLSGTYL